MTEEKRVIKIVDLTKDEFAEISPQTDLQNIISECSKILDKCGYSDYLEAITKGRENAEAYYFAGKAILHAKSALKKMAGQISNDAVFNAMRAVQNQNLATMRHTAMERDMWAGMKARRGALKTSEGRLKNQLEARSELVGKCRLRGKTESMIPRYVAAMEGGYANAGLVPKKKVDNMRRYLQKHGLISKK